MNVAKIHLAAKTSVPFSMKNPELTGDVNVGGTLNLLYSCVKERVDKFVFASTCAVYGEPKSLPVSERHELYPTSPYAGSKVMAERFCLGFHERRLLKSVVLRLFNVYGPGQGLNEYSGVITRFFGYCGQGLPLTIYGDGSQTRDFVHVYDVADFFLRVLESNEGGGQVFNVGYDKPITILELAHVCSRINDRPPNIVHAEPRAGDIRHSFADISKAQQLLGYKPSYALEDGLETLADEFSEIPVQ